MTETATGNCEACWHLWSKHGPDGCTGKVFPAHSLTGEPCPCEHAGKGPEDGPMTETGDLIAFLGARLDEDEASATSAALAWTASVWDSCDFRLGPAVGGHIARHDPARTLREVAAGRALLDLYERATHYRDRIFAQPEPRSISDEMRAVTQMMALEQVMRLRTAIWSDHPDYRQDWSPADA
jgi:hypothetical protein